MSVVDDLTSVGFLRLTASMYRRGPNDHGVEHYVLVDRAERLIPHVQVSVAVRHSRIEQALVLAAERLRLSRMASALARHQTYTLGAELGVAPRAQLTWERRFSSPGGIGISLAEAATVMARIVTISDIHARYLMFAQSRESWVARGAQGWLRHLIIVEMLKRMGYSPTAREIDAIHVGLARAAQIPAYGALRAYTPRAIEEVIRGVI